MINKSCGLGWGNIKVLSGVKERNTGDKQVVRAGMGQYQSAAWSEGAEDGDKQEVRSLSNPIET